VQLDQLSGANQLNEDVEIAFQTIKLMAENSDREWLSLGLQFWFSRQKIVTCGSI